MSRTRIVVSSPPAQTGDAAPALGVHVSRPAEGPRLLPTLASTALWALPALSLLLGFAFGAGGSAVGDGALLSVGLGLLVHALWARPLLHVGRAVRAESRRLREALTCPYCRDGHEDHAVLCDRDGCGAFYHPECWDECRTSYGGCAIFGCGCTSAHAVGRFALRKRAWRLLVAAILFPPKAARRLRELEGQSFAQIWADASAHQAAISHDRDRTLRVGLYNLCASASVLIAILFAFASAETWIVNHYGEAGLVSGIAATMLAVMVLPILLMRFPLAQAFLRGSAKLVGRAFRDELAALGRADEGTLLARLAAGLGKKA